MPQGLSGLTVASYDFEVLDVGMAVGNIDMAKLVTAPFVLADVIGVAGAKPLGAFDAGASLDPGFATRQMKGSGTVTPVKGADRRAKGVPSIEVSLVEIGNPDILELAMPGAVTATEGDFKTVIAGPISTASYLDTLAFFTTVKGKAAPIVLVLFNAIATSFSPIQTADGDEAVLKVKFEGRAPEPNGLAYKWYTPTT